MNTRYLLLVVALAAAVVAEKVSFQNYRVYRVTPETEGQLAMVREMETAMQGLDFWRGASRVGEPVDVMVPPHLVASFLEAVEILQLKNEILIQDVQKNLDEQNVPTQRAGFGWNAYYRLDEIYSWLADLETEYPDIVTGLIGGSTYEGRQIKGVKVSYKDGNPGVFIEAGIHAREWISPATVTYILNELLTSEDPDVRDIAENYDWYIFPSTNPDGYEYTHTTNRMWRKTRSPSSVLCYGTDPNRNWGFHWMDGGASTQPCSETYAGPSAFSEVETRSLSEYITSIADKIDVYLAFHSYSQLLLIPYGHSNEHISNYDVLMKIGTNAKEALASKYGTQYKVGNIVDTIYVASGGSMDWVRGTYGTPITYTYELRDTGRYGFSLPASEIIPTGEETLDSVVVILQEGRNEINLRRGRNN